MNDLLNIVASQYGIREIPGPENNPEIMKYFHETEREWVSSEQTPWCDAFVDWCVWKAGGMPTPGLNAREWLRYGEPIEDPKPLDIVVLWRESINSWKGHVGFYINKNKHHVYVLGGNQNNMVCVQPYPIDRLLGYRR